MESRHPKIGLPSAMIPNSPTRRGGHPAFTLPYDAVHNERHSFPTKDRLPSISAEARV